LAYEIKSYWGAGTLVFGMSPDEVHELLGKPRFSRSDPGRLREIYRGCPALTFVGADGELKLVEIGFAKAAGEVIYRGANLFAGEHMAVVQRLCGEDPAPREVVGTLVFPKLGTHRPQREPRSDGLCARQVGCAVGQIEALQTFLKLACQRRRMSHFGHQFLRQALKLAVALIITIGSAYAQSGTTVLFKIITVKDEIVIGLSAAELDALGGRDPGLIANSLATKGTLSLWQYAVRKASNGDLEQAPLRKVAVFAHESLRVEAFSTPLKVVPHE